MKRAAALILPLILLLGFAACRHQEEVQGEEGYLLYFRADLERAGGADAIIGIRVDLGLGEEAAAAEIARAMVQQLIEGAGGVDSPLPDGTELQSITIKGRRAYVDFSLRYASLTGMDLSLADYCVTLTLTQLEEISAVSITANGRELPYRGSQVLQEGDVLLSTMEDVIDSVAVKLYFVTEDGELAPEERMLELYEGELLAEKLIFALLEGPQERDLYPVIPEAFTVNTIRVENRTCYLSLPAQSIEALPEEAWQQEQILQSIAYSIYSMDGVDELRIIVDGQEVTHFGQVPVEDISIRPDTVPA